MDWGWYQSANRYLEEELFPPAQDFHMEPCGTMWKCIPQSVDNPLVPAVSLTARRLELVCSGPGGDAAVSLRLTLSLL